MKPDNFQVLEFLFLGDSNIVTLSKSISRSPRLELLDIENCKQLREIPRLPQSMGMVDARNIGLDPKTSSRLLNQFSFKSAWEKIFRSEVEEIDPECGAAFKGQDPLSRDAANTWEVDTPVKPPDVLFSIFLGSITHDQILKELWFENLKHINFSNRKWTFLIVKIWLRFISLLDFFISLKNGTSHTMRNFKFFLAKLMLKSLKYFNLEGRSSLEKFPNIHPIMKCLEVLELSRSGIIGLLSSIGYLIALRTLYRYNCPNLSDLLDIIYKFQLLEEFVFPTTPSIWTRNSPNCSFGYGFSRSEALNLINCENITELEFFLKLEFFPVLKYLYLSQTNIVNILEYISSFTRLVVLEIISCKKLQKIPRLPQSIRRQLVAFGMPHSHIRLEKLFKQWTFLIVKLWLSLSDYKESDLIVKLVEVDDLLDFQEANGTSHTTTRNFKFFQRVLELSRSGIRGLPSSIGYLIALRTLYLYDCPNLSHLPYVIYKLQLPEESIFPTTPSIFASNSLNCSFWYGFSRLEAFYLINCENITELEFFFFFLKPEYFLVLKYLYLSQTNIVTIPKHISSFTRLVVLEIISCKKFQEIPRLPQSIRRVCAKNCWSLDPLTSSRLLD
ncbi:hypothetical protein CFP56_021487 [Quercus suber]|uniref:Maturase K n=1 Tax=Quercus suber TaxID=58331 RepID=A0AAW0KD37_QUESU